MIPQGELFSFVFLKNSKHWKDISKLTDLYKIIDSVHTSISAREHIERAGKGTWKVQRPKKCQK